mmetsp:Transcript_22539/g.57731  ORF Transcript_22539/g.57731 Transcript_22539/m.57731 type:complete len:308 (-) Transcript_22539:89-1012(-)
MLHEARLGPTRLAPGTPLGAPLPPLPRVLPHISLGEHWHRALPGRPLLRTLPLLRAVPRVAAVHLELQAQPPATALLAEGALLLAQQVELQAANARVAEAHVEGVVRVGEAHGVRRRAEVHRSRHREVLGVRKRAAAVVHVRAGSGVEGILHGGFRPARPRPAALPLAPSAPSCGSVEAHAALLRALLGYPPHIRQLSLHGRRFLLAAHLDVQRPEVLIQGMLPCGYAGDIVHKVVVARSVVVVLAPVGGERRLQRLLRDPKQVTVPRQVHPQLSRVEDYFVRGWLLRYFMPIPCAAARRAASYSGR